MFILDKRLAAVLSFVAGFVDTATFIGLCGMCSMHVTGNFTLIAANLVQGLEPDQYLKLLCFPVFVASVSISTWTHTVWVRKGYSTPSLYLLIGKGLLLLFVGVIAVILHRVLSSGVLSVLDTILAILIVFAMGIQTTVHRLNPKCTPVTTAMTGNVVQLILEMTHLASDWVAAKFGTQQHSPLHNSKKMAPLLAVIAGFGFGCIASALLTKWIGLSSVLLPGVLVLGAVADLKRRLAVPHRKPAASLTSLETRNTSEASLATSPSPYSNQESPPVVGLSKVIEV